MTFEKLRKKLDSRWIKRNNIWDVVIYGSYARGKAAARDIDIAMILSQPTSVKAKLLLAQELRRMLSGDDLTLDVKAIDMNDFLDVGFLGREAIIAEGRSLVKKDYLAERFGFTALAIVEYDFKNLTASQKKLFYYTLQGRTKGTGFLAKTGGRIVSKGVLHIPTRYYEELKDLLEQHKVDHKTTFTLQYRILQ